VSVSAADPETVNAYSVEISVHGWQANEEAEITPYTEEDCKPAFISFSRIIINIDLMHGRRLCRSLWEYYKVQGIISESSFIPERILKMQQKQDQQLPSLADGFSMLRLQSIAKQRDIFSSLESLTSSSGTQGHNLSANCLPCLGEETTATESTRNRSRKTSRRLKTYLVQLNNSINCIIFSRKKSSRSPKVSTSRSRERLSEQRRRDSALAWMQFTAKKKVNLTNTCLMWRLLFFVRKKLDSKREWDRWKL